MKILHVSVLVAAPLALPALTTSADASLNSPKGPSQAAVIVVSQDATGDFNGKTDDCIRQAIEKAYS